MLYNTVKILLIICNGLRSLQYLQSRSSASVNIRQVGLRACSSLIVVYLERLLSRTAWLKYCNQFALTHLQT